MFKISYNITIGSNSFKSSQANYLVSLETNSALNVPVNSCSIVLQTNDEISINVGDPVEVELGYDDTVSKVFTGLVAACEYGISEIYIEVLSSFTGLTTSAFNLVYEQQSCGDIISDLVGRVDISTDMIQFGLTLATYVMSDNTNVWKNIKTLSQKCGLDFFANHEDKAVCKMFIPGKPHMFQYGSNIISFEMKQTNDEVSGVEVYGESPVGQGQSDDASSWFTNKDVKGAAGDTTGFVLGIQDPLARNTSNAQLIADNIMNDIKKKEIANTTVIGNSELYLTDCVMVNNMPVSAKNSMYKVRSVQHIVNSYDGFVTNVSMEKLA